MEMPRGERVLVLLLTVIVRGSLPAAGDEEAAGCGEGEAVTFEKWSGARAARGEPVFVHGGGGGAEGLAGACTARCRREPRCAAVAVAHARAECIGYAHTDNRTLLQDNDVNFFLKICMKLPAGCEARWWAVEAAAGYSLLAAGGLLLHNLTSEECSRALVRPNSPHIYRSAQWVAVGDEDVGGDSQLGGAGGERGACALHVEDRSTEPESYRVANFRTLYKESQCRHDFPAKIERCSYEEYYNQTLKHAELSLAGLSKDECKMSCEREVRFVCRGFSWRSLETERGEGPGECSLHSEDMLTLGSWLLKRAPNTSYYRRVICLNISVECSEDQMVVTYRPRGEFRGRLLVPGRGDACGAAAARGRRVRLALPLRGPCDVNFAYAVTKGPLGIQNKTMAYAMVMIQNNPIIQTAGDRWVRVGCSPGARASQPLDAALTVSVDTVKASEEDGGAGAVGAGAVPASAVYNTSGAAQAPLTMYVVRASGGGAGAEPRGAVSLGEILELRVETTDESEIEAYHLVASSRLGDSSVLLLDNRGCSTGQVDFPEFARSWVGGGGQGGGGGLQRLSARFKAFRFPHSHVVRFTLMVRFCDHRCPRVECSPEPSLRSRTARHVGRSATTAAAPAAAATPAIDLDAELSTNEVESGERADVREDAGSSSWDHSPLESERASTGDSQDSSSGLVVAQSGPGASNCGVSTADRVPLELELLVGSRDLLTADTLVRAEHLPREEERTPLAAAAAAEGGLVCMHELVVAALVLAWLAVQLLLLVSCCVVVKRYRKFAELASQKDYQSFDNVGFDTLSTHRRVHWPDQNVDILHVN